MAKLVILSLKNHIKKQIFILKYRSRNIVGVMRKERICDNPDYCGNRQTLIYQRKFGQIGNNA